MHFKIVQINNYGNRITFRPLPGEIDKEDLAKVIDDLKDLNKKIGRYAFDVGKFTEDGLKQIRPYKGARA